LGILSSTFLVNICGNPDHGVYLFFQLMASGVSIKVRYVTTLFSL